MNRRGAAHRRWRRWNRPGAAAAATPLAGVTTLQALRDKGNVQAGPRVLMNGASGGVGTLAVQVAKAFGAEVTAVCTTAKVNWCARWAPTTWSSTRARTSRAATGATTS